MKNKFKYIIVPLTILSLILAYVPFPLGIFKVEEVSATGWLAGWDNRIELAIGDYAGDIGGSVTWFPVSVFLTSTQGEEVFVELTTDAEYLKVAFTKADGTTELYGEKELFDVSEELGIFHVSRDGWVINANTSIYMYYDKDHADNTTYIGAIGTRTEVWDGNHKIVYHMPDLTTSTVEDSTSNNNDGTKKGANEPIEATGKVGQAQDFDGTDDYIDIALGTTYTTRTISFIFKATNLTAEDALVIADGAGWQGFSAKSSEAITYHNEAGGGLVITSIVAGTWYHIALVVENGVDMKLYKDGLYISATETVTTQAATICLGTKVDHTTPSIGIIDEVHTSSTNRSAAWIKATYNSLWDTLLTYGNEESQVIYYAKRSTSANDDSSWQAETEIGRDSSGFGHMSLVPMGSEKVMALFNDYDGTYYNLKYRIYNSSWGASTTLATDCKDNTSSDNWDEYHWFSAVADSSNIHVIYVDSDDNDLNYIYYSDSSWSSAQEIYTGTVTHPSLSYDSTTGNLVAFFIEGNAVKYKVKKSGSWGDPSGGAVVKTGLDSPSYLGSAYSDATSIGIIWRETSSSPYAISYAILTLSEARSDIIRIKGGIRLKGGLRLK